jgi:hypothetical protein
VSFNQKGFKKFLPLYNGVIISHSNEEIRFKIFLELTYGRLLFGIQTA